jgi:phenylacetate-CoA ligase
MEMVEPGIAGECTAKDGLHLAEDQFLAEVVHPVTGEVLQAGQEGELVLTTLTAEAYPLIRYRTGDVTVLRQTICSCGRTSARIIPILRRTDNRISVRGIPIYPEQVETILRRIDNRIEDFRLVVETACGVGEQLELLIVRPDRDFPEGSRSHYMETLRSQLRRTFGLGARIQLVEPHRLPREGLIYKTVFRNASS